MASDYGLNFGFRRSDESNATREGRQKTPATGSALLLGSAVQLDPAAPGYLKLCAADADPQTGLTGLLVQEESHLGSVFQGAPLLGHDSIDLGSAKLDQLSTMWGGPSKIWLQNSPAYARGTRSKAAVAIVDLTGVAIGDSLKWNGSKWVKATGTTHAWMTVTLVNTATSGKEYCEAVLNF